MDTTGRALARRKASGLLMADGKDLPARTFKPFTTIGLNLADHESLETAARHSV